MSSIVTPPSTPKGVLFFAHGSSMPDWRLPFDRLLANVQQQHPNTPCALGFLERTQPDFRAALEHILAKLNPNFRAQAPHIHAAIHVVPLFLAHSVHTARDLPRLVGQALDDYPALEFTLGKSLLEDEAIFNAMQHTLATSCFHS